MKKLIILLVLILIFVISGCAETKFTTNVIMFDNIKRPPTNKNQVYVYNSRLNLPSKFIEIGTIKYEGRVNENFIKELGAIKGADAIISDQGNYILIKFIKEEEENSDDTKTL